MAKKFLALALVLMLVVSLAACTPPATDPTQPQQGTNPKDPTQQETLPTVQHNEWAVENKINDGSQTAAELYELAKKEGSVVLYSISSRCTKVADSFNAQYPGVVCEAYDLGSGEIVEKITREHEAGIVNCDVVHCKDMDGTYYQEFVLENIMHVYRPDDITAHIPESLRQYTMPMYVELQNWFYNYELCDEQPINSWWDLTKPEWAGKFYFTVPTSAGDITAALTALTAYSDEFAANYKEVFGKDIEYTCGVENAVYELIYRLAKNNPLTLGTDASLEALSLAEEVYVAMGPSSKLRNNASKGWKLKEIKIEPYVGIPATNVLYIVDHCPHPNAAKLLVRWMMGEADGTGEGNKPFQTLGGWSVRDDIADTEGMCTLEDMNIVPENPAYVYDNISDLIDFCLSIAG